MFLVQTPRAPSGAILAMSSGALTPEELETLLEDTFVVRDRTALAGCSKPTGSSPPTVPPRAAPASKGSWPRYGRAR